MTNGKNIFRTYKNVCRNGINQLCDDNCQVLLHKNYLIVVKNNKITLKSQ